MSLVLGLPTRGSDITVLITKVHLHPLCVLVEFWGKFSQERTEEYECLAKDIQSPGNSFQELEGKPGDKCLVQVDGTWYRSRIVSRNGLKYSVFLIDKGMTFSTTTSKLAWGKEKHFQLPPEVEFCVLANVLPLPPENRWSPVALDYLKSLSGKSVKAHVQDVLVLHRTFLLHIPCISKQMYEMGFAKMLSPGMFQDFVLLSLQSQGGGDVSLENQETSIGAGERLHKQDIFMYPELLAGTVETVIVTDVTNPQRFFCQLKVFSQELKKLSEQITQCCEGRMTTCIVGPEMIGFPCAARGSDGRWYRSVLQQVFPTNRVVEVLNVDYGTKQCVPVESVRPLAPEFFRMPVVTYNCALHGIIDKGVGWTSSQIEFLRSLLLYKTVIAKFEYQSISEGVHYVTLYGDENTNINNLFGSKESCSLDFEKTLEDYAIKSTAYSLQHPALPEKNKKNMSTLGLTVKEKEGKDRVKTLPTENLSLGSSHVAVVQHITDPSEFWIQTQNYANEFDKMMDSIKHLYKDSLNKDMVQKPVVGLHCVAKAENGDFYRATVADIGETELKVFFVDYGNTEAVDRSNIRTLPDEFRKLPCLALKCTLAGIRPKEGRWSRSACEFFISTVTDKTLNTKVIAKHDEGYAVQLADPKAPGEKDLATLMCRSGIAERAETQRQPKAKITTQCAVLPPPQLSDTRLSAVKSNNGMCLQTLNKIGTSDTERRIPTFKEHMFPIGSVLDVSVSYIESPNDFWCQLVRNAGHLKLLMHDLQAHYGGSEFQPLVETACVARHPDNGMWYRALVIHKHKTPHVDVLFVDYGQTETVSLYDLRRICPEFLTLHGQAFRCSLLNPVDPSSATNEWNEDAIARFHSFVETAASNFVILKCTIYAVMFSEQKIVFNIVDLETPFESISTGMVNLVKGAPPKKSNVPSFRLDTYYYSTHNVKTGTEEQVTVTCVNNVSQFYCQLKRNADVIKDLKIKVNSLCHQLENIKLPTVFGALCFAKYIDGQWYRGQIKASKPSILVHFVDYGDTIEVEKSDLLPVPREANDIMSVPVQAVVCSLSDIPSNVPREANSWFEISATECKFRALVVAREPDGKLLVELYHGNTQINSKIKKMFRIEMRTEDQVVYQGKRMFEASESHASKTPKAVPTQAAETKDQTIRKNFSTPKPACQTRNADMNLKAAKKPLRHCCENGQRVKAAPLELYRPPPQRQSHERTPNNTEKGSDLEDVGVKPSVDSLPTETEQLVKSISPDTESQKKVDVEKIPKLKDLPSKYITSGMEADVYVSHCNSPLSFYVQLVREENEIFSLVKMLNDPHSSPQIDIKDMHPGDLVQAEFKDDSSWYRAVVREMHSSTMALVEFIDFGNTELIPISKMGRIHKNFLHFPMYSTHCMLSDATALGKKEVLDPEVISAFKKDISGTGEKVLKCQFIRQSGSMWEVSLKDSGINVICKVPSRCSTDVFKIPQNKLEQGKEKPTQSLDIRQVAEKSQLNSCSLCYRQQEFLEGQKLQVYITTTNDTLTFWCQSTDSEELDKVTSGVSEVGNAPSHKNISPGSLTPGTLCIALFSDDNLWYRAEVIDREGDELSVFFIDYGNMSQVNVKDVREMHTDLMETPAQAFLCELEGFDAAHGSWDSGAVDAFSELTIDKTLQLTITGVTREEGKIKCLVQMDCEGQVFNETLKTWWKFSRSEDQPGAVGLTTSNETSLQCDTSVEETTPPKDQQEYSESQEIYTAVACVCTCSNNSEEQKIDKLVDPQPTDEVLILASKSEYVKTFEDLHSESFLQSTEEILSECSMTTGPQLLKTTESARETIPNEEVNIAPTMVHSQTNPKEILPHDSGIDETMLPAISNKYDQGILTFACDSVVVETVKGTGQESASVMDTVALDHPNFPLDENLTEVKNDSEFASTELKFLPEEVKTYSIESSADIIKFSDPNEQKNYSEVTIARDNPPSSTTVKMIPRKAIPPRKSSDLKTIDKVPEDLKQNQTLPAFPFLPPTVEQEMAAEDGIRKKEVPCGSMQVKNELLVEEVTLGHHEDTHSVASEPQTCTSPPQNLDYRAKEMTCSTEELCFTDVFTDPNEPSDYSEVTSSGDNCMSSRTAKEMQQNKPLPLCGELLHEQLIVLPSDNEPQAKTISCPDLVNLVEEVTYLVGEISLTDISKDQQEEAEKEDSEQLVPSSPKQKEDFSNTVLEEEMLSSDDSFEVQLTKITHLSLIVNGGCADTLSVEQPEESAYLLPSSVLPLSDNSDAEV